LKEDSVDEVDEKGDGVGAEVFQHRWSDLVRGLALNFLRKYGWYTYTTLRLAKLVDSTVTLTPQTS